MIFSFTFCQYRSFHIHSEVEAPGNTWQEVGGLGETVPHLDSVLDKHCQCGGCSRILLPGAAVLFHAFVCHGEQQEFSPLQLALDPRI